jgi:hypothetical protein
MSRVVLHLTEAGWMYERDGRVFVSRREDAEWALSPWIVYELHGVKHDRWIPFNTADSLREIREHLDEWIDKDIARASSLEPK